jgi:lipid-binding SYLF domain-containing protein
MKSKLFTTFLTVIFILSVSVSVNAQDDKEEKKKNPYEERAEILKMKDKALKELYKLNPGAKAEIASAKGYAVFGNTGINVLVVSSGNGTGVAYKNGKPTFMKMYSAGVGVGVGVKKFYAIFIFKTTQAYDNFVEEGWQGGAQADAAAQDNNQGDSVAGAISLSPDIELYQITSKGLAAQATIQGTKYWKDKDLN